MNFIWDSQEKSVSVNETGSWQSLGPARQVHEQGPRTHKVHEQGPLLPLNCYLMAIKLPLNRH